MLRNFTKSRFLWERHFLEVGANDPNNRSLEVQVINVHTEGFSCGNPLGRSCFSTPDLASNESLIVLNLDGTWGGGRDPAMALIAVSGSTAFSDSGYSIFLGTGEQRF